jgi:hypothetical protein
MIIAGLFSLLLILCCAFIHYEILGLLNTSLSHLTLIPRRAKVLAALLCATVSHCCHICLFALAYFLLDDRFGLGRFGGKLGSIFSGYLYFSTETYTSLGFGDIFPLGELRMLAGVESLTGLLMISWTASFTFFAMNEYWRKPGRPTGQP